SCQVYGAAGRSRAELVTELHFLPATIFKMNDTPVHVKRPIAHHNFYRRKGAIAVGNGNDITIQAEVDFSHPERLPVFGLRLYIIWSGQEKEGKNDNETKVHKKIMVDDALRPEAGEKV